MRWARMLTVVAPGVEDMMVLLAADVLVSLSLSERRGCDRIAAATGLERLYGMCVDLEGKA